MLVLSILYILTQYDGPPMWDRGEPYWDQRRWENRQPPPRRWGPQKDPCIYFGDCRGPRDRDLNDPRPYPMPPDPFPPPRYDDY